MTQSQEKIVLVMDSIKHLLLEKNKRYGDSALNPKGVFFKKEYLANPADISSASILIRLDDKFQRIDNSGKIRKNDVADIIGYLGLLCVAKDWTDFSDLID